MFRNESGHMLPTKAALGEQEVLLVLDALLVMRDHVAILAPLNRKVIDYIGTCTREDLLRTLADHSSAEVRCAVASNLKLSEELVWKLACDDDFRVRARLAENQNLASFLLETLAEDEDDRVAHKANKSLDKQNAGKISNRVIDWVFASLAVKQTG